METLVVFIYSSYLYISIDFTLQIVTISVVNQRHHQTIYIKKAEFRNHRVNMNKHEHIDILPEKHLNI